MRKGDLHGAAIHWLAVASVHWALGCSLLVDPESLVVQCAPYEEANEGCPRNPQDSEGAPTCVVDPCYRAGTDEEGLALMRCEAGTCRACQPRAERCDGVDNDCNGLVDDVPFGSCDALQCTGGSDDPPECHEPACTAASCGSTQVCDQVSGRCVTPAVLGSACNHDSECPGGFCIHAEALGIGGGGSFCGKACCSDANCVSGVCFAPGTGARSCVPVELVDSAQAAAPCDHHADCASGVCDDGRCQTVCATHSDCASGACVFQETSGGAFFTRAGQFVCGWPREGTSGGSPCNPFVDSCASGLCLDVGGGSIRCAEPCGRSSDCGELGRRCLYRDTSWFGPNARVAVCAEAGHGDAMPGGNCDSGEDCIDGDCVNGTCLQTCCLDSHCPRGQRCKGHQHLGRWRMVCLPG